MLTKLQKAINNNISLYQAILRYHDIQLQTNEDVAYTEEKTPRYYSNLITRSPYWQPDILLHHIDAACKSAGWDEWTMKDSYQILNLIPYGFEKLFDAQWFYLEASRFQWQQQTNLCYKIIRSEKDLIQWRLKWDEDTELGKVIFNQQLLQDAGIWMIAGYNEEQLVTGCFINDTGEVLGLSNFFAADEAAIHWPDLIHYVFTAIGIKDIVGFERECLIQQLRPTGIEPIGNLSIWLKKFVAQLLPQ